MTSGFQLAFWVGAGIAFVGVIAALVLIRQEEIVALAPALEGSLGRPGAGAKRCSRPGLTTPELQCKAGVVRMEAVSKR